MLDAWSAVVIPVIVVPPRGTYIPEWAYIAVIAIGALGVAVPALGMLAWWIADRRDRYRG